MKEAVRWRPTTGGKSSMGQTQVPAQWGALRVLGIPASSRPTSALDLRRVAQRDQRGSQAPPKGLNKLLPQAVYS